MKFFFKARHIYICEHHKNMIQSVRSKRKRKDSDDETEMTEVRFMMFSYFFLCFSFYFFYFFYDLSSYRALRLIPRPSEPLNHYSIWHFSLVYVMLTRVEFLFLCVIFRLYAQVDFCQLQVNTLRRYKRHYKLQTRPGLNKSQLVEV